ncbi:MAG TPA: trehalase family glycosidase [Anaerolineaceae bacterium]|nr:trehalase family glycosidase [Anaerolineaceae bacterium]
MQTTLYLNLLRNHIDLTQVPFSDRGSRLLVFQTPKKKSLFVKLAERLTGIEPGIEAYLRRPPFIHDLCFTDAEGEPLDFEVITHPHVVYFQTRLGEIALVFQDRRTLSFGLPADQTIGLRFVISPEFWQASESGGTFKYVRNASYTSNGEVVENSIHPQRDGYRVDFMVKTSVDTAITIHISPELDTQHPVLPFSSAYSNAETRWKSWFERVPPVSNRFAKTYAYAWWVMANNLISPQGKVIYEAMTPSKITYVGLWLWDNAMHSLAYRHIDSDIARNQIRAMLAHQLPNGMLPDAIYDEGVVATIDHPISAEVTKPPILAWAAMKLHETDPDIEFLKEIYIPLIRLNAWWFTMNDDDDDGLMQYNHPYSSGADDSPLWDYGMPVESPDLNTYICIQMQALAEIAEAIGLDQEATMWRRRASALVRRMIKDFWDEDAGVFWAYHQDEHIPVLTPFNLFPLWTGLLPEKINERLIACLTDPRLFWGDYVIPTVAFNDPHFSPITMWRGPIWTNINYFFIEALRKVGKCDLAKTIRDKTLEMMMKHDDIFEFYNPITGEPPETAAHIFGWSSAVFIDLAIQASQEEGAD